MATFIRMPKMGLTMTDGEVTKWFKEEGDEIKKGEIICEVATDKIANEIESDAAGTILKIIVEEGNKALVKDPIAIVGIPGEDISDMIIEENNSEIEEKEIDKKENKKESTIANMSIENNGYIKASPLAKKIAKEKGIELSLIKATGPEGRIVEKDVRAYNDSKGKFKTTSMARKTADYLNVDLTKVESSGRIVKDDVLRFYKNNKIQDLAKPYDNRQPMDKMRKVISERMSYSWNISPAVTYEISVDVTKLSELKKDLKLVTKVTYTDLIVKILSKVLLKHKELNSSVDGNEIIYRNYVNMGVAVAIDNGLLVPVVKYSNIKSLGEISLETKELAEKARTNQLKSEELTGGTFTVTNLGMYGIEGFSPIINQPETAILGICTIKDTPIVNEKKEIEIKPLMKLCLTADHRVVDGAVAASFMQDLKMHIENPAMLLV